MNEEINEGMKSQKICVGDWLFRWVGQWSIAWIIKQMLAQRSQSMINEIMNSQTT